MVSPLTLITSVSLCTVPLMFAVSPPESALPESMFNVSVVDAWTVVPGSIFRSSPALSVNVAVVSCTCT